MAAPDHYDGSTVQSYGPEYDTPEERNAELRGGWYERDVVDPRVLARARRARRLLEQLARRPAESSAQLRGETNDAMRIDDTTDTHSVADSSVPELQDYDILTGYGRSIVNPEGDILPAPPLDFDEPS